ncbi:MAG: hypothetical protein K2N73_12570, partial [Lachnospiraceae bacterium]|nr:hypothetical protein [Lachnospiraceae bacterium]
MYDRMLFFQIERLSVLAVFPPEFVEMSGSRAFFKHALEEDNTGFELNMDGFNITVHTYTKVVGIMRQNACLLAFCVQN